jgi:hypothetical protein
MEGSMPVTGTPDATRPVLCDVRSDVRFDVRSDAHNAGYATENGPALLSIDALDGWTLSGAALSSVTNVTLCAAPEPAPYPRLGTVPARNAAAAPPLAA